jgi:tartrate dehydrogenase/decarboxylase/D-malate dehydrogenase
MKRFRIAAIPGDGIGKEIIPEGLKVLQAVAVLEHFNLDVETFPWGAEHYMQTGEFMPSDGLTRLKEFDTIYFGAIGHPDVDDSLPAKHYMFRVRKALHQYVNLRPIRLLPGVEGPLRNKGTEDIDFVIIRENAEGEFAEVGGIVNPDQPDGLSIQTGIFTRRGVERVAHYAFKLARARRGKMTNVTKSNALSYGLVYWDQVIEGVHQSYPDVEYEKLYVDAAAMSFVLRPERFDVILTTNMFGDILSDLGGALMGSLGLAPSGNINPERQFPSMFEPIHGSAPDIAGRGIANPLGTIWSGALMLEHLEDDIAAKRVMESIIAVLQDKQNPRPVDLGGQATTDKIGDAVVRQLTENRNLAQRV